MDNKTLSDLIGLIYDVAFDSTLWPGLLQRLADELDPLLIDVSDRKRKHCVSQTAVMDLLQNHITRALELNRRLCDAEEEVLDMQDLFDRLPLGMLMVDHEGRILTCNRLVNRILSEGKGIAERDHLLCAETPAESRRLRQAIRAASEDKNGSGQTLHLSPSEGAIPLSLLLIPFKTNAAVNGAAKNSVVVLVAAPGMKMEIAPETLKSFYPLTKAEARLLSALICDRDLNSIALDFGISKNTARNQLKSIYEKTGVHRQAELVRQIITGPAMLATICGQDKPFAALRLLGGASVRGIRSRKRENQTVKLPDGRQLGFAEYGAAGGRPVVYMHAFNGSRLERHPDEAIIEQCGVRLIIPDRPGVGLSDHQKDLTFSSWAGDVRHLADHLGLSTFSMMGYSIGAPFGLACAYHLKKRINHVIVVCGVGSFDSIWELEGMYLPLRVAFTMSRHAPNLLEPLLRFIGVQAPPEEYLKDLWRNLPPIDRAVVCDPAIRERILENAAENLQRREHYILQEILLVSGNWGFDLGQIDAPVDMWHGELDRIVPLNMARRMAQKMPRCRTRFLPDAGHYLIFHCWKDVLLSAVV